MKSKKDSPGVYIPPPLYYFFTFIAAIYIQKRLPINNTLFQLQWLKVFGIILLIMSLFFLVRSLRQFLQTKNTLILIKPAASLQTNGIYGVTRNPMYVGLAIVYLGLSCLLGNWWNFILFSLLLIIVQLYIIKKEEEYLGREFGQKYLDYKNKYADGYSETAFMLSSTNPPPWPSVGSQNLVTTFKLCKQ